MRRLAILGASGHGKVVADTAEATGEWDDVQFFDARYPELQQVGDWPVVGNEALLGELADTFDGAIVAIGDNATRWECQQRLEQLGLTMASVIHPRASVSPRATLGAGSVVFAGAVIQASSEVGRACIINTGASVDHDCWLGNACHLSPGAHLGGTVTLGERCWVGLGAVVKNNIELATDCVVGAGAVVIRSESRPLTLVGVPARSQG